MNHAKGAVTIKKHAAPNDTLTKRISPIDQGTMLVLSRVLAVIRPCTLVALAQS
jgi:hypothetical protein